MGGAGRTATRHAEPSSGSTPAFDRLARTAGPDRAVSQLRKRCSRKNPSFSCATRSEHENTTQSLAACSV